MDQTAPRRNWLAQSALIVFLVLALGPGLTLLTIAYFSRTTIDIVHELEDDSVVIVGIGNSGNNFSREPGRRLARILEEVESTPTITDEMLQATYDGLWQRAQAGHVDAASVIVRIAEIQRKPKEESK